MEKSTHVNLVVPVKSLTRAKSRLRGGAADSERGDRGAHAALVLAIVTDTLTATLETRAVRRVLVVTTDPVVALLARRLGADVAGDEPPLGLNAAIRHGALLLRREDAGAVVGALQADLPALRPCELSAAVTAAEGRRAFCTDRRGSGTTLLLSAPGGDLAPRFGAGSARAHDASGALRLPGAWPSLRCDVDTADDLRAAVELGLGRATSGRLVDPSESLSPAAE